MAFYDPTIFEVHVLLVDHDMSTLFETARLLQFNSYKVTPVHDASVASSMLSQDNTKFNLVMVDVESSNLQGFKLVHEAVSLDLPVIVMATSASPTLVKCAIEDGAFLFMQKPTASEELRYLWQHMLREITRESQEKVKSCGERSSNNYNQKFHSLTGGEYSEVDKTTESVTTNVRNMSTSKVTSQKGKRQVISFSSDINNVPAGECMSMRPKMCTEWTQELHQKFMAAVKQLGEGRCFPKDILELMNVPGLTRMQVASHLQKCRHGWQPSNERQGRRPKASKSSNANQSRTKKYGIFPRLIRGSQPQFPAKDNQNDAQAPIATSNNNMETSMPNSNGTQNNMNEASNEKNFTSGNIMVAPGQRFQSDASFDFAASDDGPIANNFNLNDFDLHHTVPGQAIYDAGVATTTSGTSFWSSWIANFAREL